MNNSEEYDDPELYDKEYESYLPELPLLIKWASKNPGIIIDLACGTGRVTIPLAKEGFQVMGIDVHKGMLEAAQKKSSSAGIEIEWLAEDCTDLNIGIKVSLIYTVGNSFQHFLTNEAQDGLLRSVNRHLEDEGMLIFSTRFPGAEELLQPPEEEYWRSYQDGEFTVDVSTISHYDELEQVQHYTTIRKYKDRHDEIVNEKRTNISLRYVYPKEMERLLDLHGFEILNVYEDWKETPVKNESYEMVYVCRKIR
ncbi:hypothetical protein JMA_36090 [Jeotgalibacillus malaysiensis]|uniref:Methyltransferase domain-containing protein n=1 Tax=Jeotgalibacillus malaysiensis TaxID=1508404 RepID=A0A0B5AS67_9BACL|nr:class I SAM-dependent methyltransferase [Jeotgalibacillus malaysiensis]AJD92926.1 hypothetical protein JMA_36090 [Jeotgalibacillus malaysiensis]